MIGTSDSTFIDYFALILTIAVPGNIRQSKEPALEVFSYLEVNDKGTPYKVNWKKENQHTFLKLNTFLTHLLICTVTWPDAPW
jgi:hypothetical protein